MKNKIHQQGHQYCQDCKRITLHIPKLDAVKNGQRVCDVCYRCNYYDDDTKILPDKWVVLKITPKDSDPIYKVLASFYGGYLDGDSWRINSGIMRVEDDEQFLYFDGYSGSCYKCPKNINTYGTSSLSSGIVNNIISELSNRDVGIVEVLPFDTDWLNLKYH